MNGLGLGCRTLPAFASAFLLAGCLVYPHFAQQSMNASILPVDGFFGSSRQPQFGQNSMSKSPLCKRYCFSLKMIVRI
jgi:hypothetical protein